MQRVRDTFCSFCGTKYPEPLKYPAHRYRVRHPDLGNTIPAAVVLVQVTDGARTGSLVIRPAISPGIVKRSKQRAVQ